jgi:hypothetical protein
VGEEEKMQWEEATRRTTAVADWKEMSRPSMM